MVDRLISYGLSLLVVGLITLTFGGAVVLAYRALYECVGGHPAFAALLFLAATPPALAARMLARHKDDLMDK